MAERPMRVEATASAANRSRLDLVQASDRVGIRFERSTPQSGDPVTTSALIVRAPNPKEPDMNERNLDPTNIDEAAAQHRAHATSRRAMLRRVAVGAAAAGAASVAVRGRPALAADPNDLNLLVVNDHTTRTGARYGGALAATAFNVETGPADTNNDAILNTVLTNGGTAFLGVANSAGPQQVGVVGWSRKANGTGVVGFTGPTGGYGGEFFGGVAELRLRPGGAAPITLTNAHQVGELYEDEAGALWICVATGTPGTWREIAGPTSAGAFHAIAPQRVYDTRPDRKLVPATDRVFSVANSIGGVADVVPAGATAVAATVTVTETEGATGGFVSIRPGDTPDNGTSSINWWNVGQTLATTVIVGVNATRQVVAKPGPTAAHLIVDITGYYR